VAGVVEADRMNRLLPLLDDRDRGKRLVEPEPALSVCPTEASNRAAFPALWHDSRETRTGDLPHTATAYLTKLSPLSWRDR
jgi:hypothetical protein